MTTHSLSMRLLSVLLTLALVFTLTEPASESGGYYNTVKAEESADEQENYAEESPSGISDASWSVGLDDDGDASYPDTADQNEDPDGLIPGNEDEFFSSPEVRAIEINDPVPSPFDEEPLEIRDESIKGELVEKREEYEKRFRLSDGSIGSVLYQYPIHEKDLNEEWQEIDNRLISEKDADGKTVYRRTSLHDTILFPEEPHNGELYTVKTETGSIRFGLGSVNEGTKAEFSPVEIPEGYSLLVPKSAGDHLRYKDVLPFILNDFRLIGHTLKEDLVLETEEALEGLSDPGTGLYTFTYKLSLKGYSAVRKDERTISILDPEGKEIYEITAPYMYDSQGEISEGLTLTLEDSNAPDPEEGSDTLTYNVLLTVEKAWLTSEERVFPVTIDPSLTYLIGGTGAFSCSTCYSASPATSVHTELAVGRSGSEQNFRAVFKINTLPSLTESETVINAVLGFVAVTYSALGASHLGPVTVNLHPLTDSVTVSNITWNTLSSHYSGIVTDSETVSGNYDINTTRPRVYWDVTKTVKEWYLTGNNYGMAMISENEDPSSVRYLRFNNGLYSTDEAILPTFSLTYLNQEGLEGYLSYHSSGSDTMGTVSVGDFNGNLVYTYTDLSMTGQYLPVSISHVYNASRKTETDVVSSSMRYGKGMRLNLSLRIETSTVPGYPYKFTDSDGTVHYFSLKSGTSGEAGSVYQKEFETTTLLTKTSTGYTLNPRGDLTYTFNSSGFLTKITDITNNKTQTLTYTGGRLTSVKDGGNRTTTLNYNSSGYLTSITDPAGRSTSYAYNANNCLTTITRPDGKTVTLTYVSKGGGYLLSKVKDIDNTSVGIGYYNSAPYRVKELIEYSSPNAQGTTTQGRKLTFTYNSGETTVTDREGRSETMLFDNSGHTVSVRDNLGNAFSGNYNNTNDNKKHALTYASSLQGSVTNYLVNHDFENTTLIWKQYNVSNTDGSYEVSTEDSREGNKSLKIVSTGNTQSYGVYQNVTIPNAPGKTVTLSAYLRYGTGYTLSSNGGFRLNVRYKDSSGTWVNNYSKPLPNAEDWHRVSWTVSIPEDASSNDICTVLVFLRQTGTVYVDSVQFEEGAVSNRYNLLDNGHIKDGTGTARPTYWSGVYLEASDQVVSEGHHDHYVGTADGGGNTGEYSNEGTPTNGYLMTGNSHSVKRIFQNVTVKDGTEGDSYVFGVWAKADPIPKVSPYLNTNRHFSVRIRFIKSDETYTEKYFPFEAKTSNWQYLSGTYVAPHGYVKVQIALCYHYQKNTATFDDVCLFRERYGERYVYDSEGRVTEVIGQNGLLVSYEYLASGRPEVKKITYPGNQTVDFTYDSTTRRLLTVTDTSGKTVSYSYDADGNQTKAETSQGGATLNSNISAYTGNYLSSVTDPFGNTTSYSYNQNKGTLSALTNAKNVVTNYSYNSNNDLLTKVKTGTSEVSYGYSTENRLSTLSHNTSSDLSGNPEDSVTYSFQYNAFGTQTGIRVGTQSLASYTFGSYNGDLIRTDYGNGQYSVPSYDPLGRIRSISYNGSTAYEYFYGTDGKTGLVKDLGRDLTWRYEYDRSGRLTSSASSEGERHSYTYSSSTGELIKSITGDAGGNTNYLTQYEYGPYNNTTGERLLKELRLNGDKVKVSYNYDNFYRTEKEVRLHTDYTLNTSCTYRQGTGTNSTSFLPETQTETLTDPDDNTVETVTLSYTYDSLGNIETISEGGVQRQKYYYDDLNQLVREDNLDLNKTIIYSYDLGGNITSTTEYAYQMGSTVSGTPTITNTYSYTDSNWKDKLTSYNGNNITYDAIGNPLSYYNGFSFTWEKGRQLASATNGTDTVTYTYDHEGHRVSKTVNGITSSYTLEGDKVLFERNGDTNLWYYYDASGAPVAIKVDNVIHLYQKNLQGDITGIYSGLSGELLVSYVYDAWGKPVITDEADTDESAELIELNPYLYRGYRYDSETGLYYLQSRYYDPETGRFVNADIFVSTGNGVLSANMFAYCENNPVMGYDPSGYVPILYSVMMTDGGDHGSQPDPGIRDVTQEVDTALQEYIKRGNTLSPHIFPTPAPVAREAIKYYYFYNLVNHKAPWDIKQKIPWEETIGTPFPGEETVVKYHDVLLTPHELGNYTYGILGREFGIPFEFLIGGSYVAAHFPTSGDALYDEVCHDWKYITLGYFGGYR